MPDLTHLWQRFLLAAAMLAGLAVGVGATVFGYSNLDTIDIHWSVLQLRGVPVWTVVLVPITLILIAGTVFHWLDGLHHFSEHMRHRRRVNELEAEVTRLKAHLDQALGMPQHGATEEAAKAESKATSPETETATVDAEMAGLGTVEEAKPATASSGSSKKKGKGEDAPPATENGDGKVAEPAIAASTSSAANDQD